MGLRPLSVVFVLFGVAAIVTSVVQMIKAGRVRKQLARWRPALGVVVGNDRGTVQVMQGPSVGLRYPIVEYTDVTGETQQGRAISAASWQRFPPGQQVSLPYDPGLLFCLAGAAFFALS